MSQFVYVDPTPAPPPFTYSYVASYTSTTSGTTHTFTGCSLSTAAAGRVIVVNVTMQTAATPGGGGGAEISSGTIAGLTATSPSSADASGSRTATGVMYATVDSGTSGTIAVTFNGTVEAASIHVYALYTLSSSTPHDTAAVTDSSSTTIDVPAGGVVIGVAVNDTAGVTWTLTGITENAHADYSADAYCTASQSSVSTETGKTVRMLPSSVLRTRQSYTSWR